MNKTYIVNKHHRFYKQGCVAERIAKNKWALLENYESLAQYVVIQNTIIPEELSPENKLDWYDEVQEEKSNGRMF